MIFWRLHALAMAAILLGFQTLSAQQPGAIEGQVVLAETGEALHGASVVLLELNRSTQTDEEGKYRFRGVPPGTYHLIAHVSSALTDESAAVTVAAGGAATADFQLRLAATHEQITVTASGRTETAFEAIQPVTARNSFQLAEDIAPALGETLANMPGNGITKRSFGPGSERPIIRGFDGDRVLIMQDGIRTGTLSSQSGDHGELINTGALDRIEIVKGPGTLLYGGSAVGGVVNAISRHHEIHEHAHQGLRGYISGTGGAANAFASGSAGFEYGIGRFMIWGGGSGQSSGEYRTPEGRIPDSDTRLYNAYGGFGFYGDKMHLAASVHHDDGLYGVPFASELHGHDHGEEHEGEEHEHEEDLERVELDARRENYRLSWGLRKLGPVIQDFKLRLNYSRWRHEEVEVFHDGGRAVGTSFNNDQFICRGVFEQARRGPLTGRFGFWGMNRDYKAAGEEALSPPVSQYALAGFVLEEVDLERVRLQFGARLDHTNFDPALGLAGEQGHDHAGHDHGEEHGAEPPEARSRQFTGASASAGANVELWRGGAFVANYTHSYRPPALEELYNFGPHVGNLAFEIGSPLLDAERGNGLDLSLRHRRRRLELAGNFFRYDFSNFIFPFRTGETEGGLMVVRFASADARFTGTEFNSAFGLTGNLVLNLGLDYVTAEEKAAGTPLPRIPPLRGRAGLDWHWKGFEFKPELVLANRQERVHVGEDPTAGYSLVNLKASYTVVRGRLIHQFAVNSFNLGDTLYRNHSSFIKHLAPEIGRGVRFTYRLRFF